MNSMIPKDKTNIICKSLFSGKNKQNITVVSSAEIAQGLVKVNALQMSHRRCCFATVDEITSCDGVLCVLDRKRSLKMVRQVKGEHFVSLLVYIPFLKGGKTLLIELPPLKEYTRSLI